MPDHSSISSDVTLESALEAALTWWTAIGVETPVIAPAKPQPRGKPVAAAPARSPVKTAPPTAMPAPLTDRLNTAKQAAKGAKDLDALRAAMNAFDAGTLSDNAAQCVFSCGNPSSKIMLIGEAPGREEDAAGKPFIGPAGQLLDKMLASIGLTESDVYITNIVNWRPPGNRKPTPEEIELCRPFFTRHIELIAPQVILIIGSVSLAALTQITSIMKNRGQWQEIKIGDQLIPALPIYHPAFLLRRPELKKDAWRDLLALNAYLSENSVV